ncbi:hypothetical protein JCM8115_004429 [Rhodotorula mucilaginosa]
MRTKPKALRAPTKTDDWRPNRIRSKAFHHHALVSPLPRPSSSSADRTAAATATPTSSRSSTTTSKGVPARQRLRLDRACKDDRAGSPAMRTRRSSAASSGTAPDSTAGSSSPPATGTKVSTPTPSQGSKAKQVLSSPPDLPPDLLRLVHPSSASLGDPTEKPGRGAYRSCDACSRRREKCDRYTVCGSCIIHETICIWSKCKPLYERSGALLGGASSDDRIAKRQAEVDQLRTRIGQLAHRVGLEVEDVLDPEKIRHYLKHGLPPSWPKSGCKQEGAAA